MIPALGTWVFTPEERLGGGGYAQSYRCRRGASGTGEYAIKIFSNPNYANTFEKEVQAIQAIAGCLGAPTLVDYGRNVDGNLCIVTAFAPGVRLDQFIRRGGRLSLDQTQSLVAQILAVLSCSHSRGLLHKDVSAFNILMDGNRFILLDWGVSETTGNGRCATIRAKQEFVAPECFYGHHNLATDFYSLGWLAVYALTGNLPYHFEDIRHPDYRVAAHCMERPILDAAIPSPMRHLISNWLNKKPDRRLVGYDLARLLEDASVYEADFSHYLEVRQINHECSYLHRAARYGVPYAQYQFALRLLKQQRRREAIYWLQEARDQGYADATCRLAMVLARDSREATNHSRELLEEAVAAGHSMAQYLLGMSLLSREGEARDVPRALDLLRLAALGGNARSQYQLGWLLKNELGRPEEAERYFAMAAERGYPTDNMSNPS